MIAAVFASLTVAQFIVSNVTAWDLDRPIGAADLAGIVSILDRNVTRYNVSYTEDPSTAVEVVFVASRTNSTIFQIIPATQQTTIFAGVPNDQGTENGFRTSAKLTDLRSMAFNPEDGHLFFTGTGCVRKVDMATMQVSNHVGSCGVTGLDSLTGAHPPTDFRMKSEVRITIAYFNGAASLFVADSANFCVRRPHSYNALTNEIHFETWTGTCGVKGLTFLLRVARASYRPSDAVRSISGTTGASLYMILDDDTFVSCRLDFCYPFSSNPGILNPTAIMAVLNGTGLDALLIANSSATGQLASIIGAAGVQSTMLVYQSVGGFANATVERPVEATLLTNGTLAVSTLKESPGNIYSSCCQLAGKVPRTGPERPVKRLQLTLEPWMKVYKVS